ncbi:phage tail length tape measure family protein [Janthinobacterium fluminis]|uniref:Phage tail length tape measure family protein n=1 Tax=Janthinobacterium fluminis TaxID=2987524 RepID=A0ABT5K0S9_9BURK|nr:phage tail length tape measure family protein [Janthinobacterium fluminis]MDC8758582.1 phage tail length tape measure family protein [Janthinobacterium fluminis]
MGQAMPDISELRVVINTPQVIEGAQALEALGDASVRTAEQISSGNAQSNRAANVMRAQAEAARDAAAAAAALGEDSRAAATSMYNSVKAAKGLADATAKLGASLMEGDVSKVKGSLTEFAQESGLAEFAVQRLGKGATLGLSLVAEAVMYVGEAYLKGREQSEKFAKSLQLTGNFAGITEGQFNTMARAIADLDNAGINKARAALQTLVSTGQFTGEAMQSVGAAAVTMAELTGQPAETVAADFAKMADGVVKWVDTHDSQYNILTTAQYEHIRALEEEGKTQEAMALTGQLYNDGLRKRAVQLDGLGSLLKSGANLWAEFNDAMFSNGRKRTPEDDIARIQERVVAMRKTRIDFNGANPNRRMNDAELESAIQVQSDLIVAALGRKSAAEAKASAAGEEARRNADGKQASKEIEAMRLRHPAKGKQEQRELKKYNDSLLAKQAAGVKMTPEEQASDRAAIRAKYADKAPGGGDDGQAALNRQLKSIQASLGLEKERLAQMAALADAQHQGSFAADESYYASKRLGLEAAGKAELDAYDAQLKALRAFHGASQSAREDNLGKIEEAEAARTRQTLKSKGEIALLDENERQRKAAIVAQSDEAVNNFIAGLVAEADQMEAANTAHEKARSVIELEAIAVNKLAIAETARSIAAAVANGESEKTIEGYQDRINALERENKARERIAASSSKVETQKQEDSMWADTAGSAKELAQSLEQSFGGVGGAIGKMTMALVDYQKAQRDIQLELDGVKSNTSDPEKIKEAETKAGRESAKVQVKQYAEMAQAASAFFDKNSAGYKVMQKAEQAYHAYQMAMTITSTAQKLLAATTTTTAVVAGKGVEATAMAAAAAVDTSTTGVSVANSATKTTASTMAGAAKAFEQLGVLGFVGAAAIIAFMVAMGSSSMSGGGGAVPTTFAERQKTQGTGTVLGDSSAKSASLSKSLAIIEGNSSLELGYQNAMLVALKNIESALNGAAKGIFQTTGLTGGSAFGTVNESTKSFWGSDTSTTITDTGVRFSGLLGDLRKGRGKGVQYEDVTHTSDGGWFSGNSSDSFTNIKALNAVALKPFTLIFDNIGEVLVKAGVQLGLDGAGLADALNKVGIDFSVSTRELKGQDLIDALSAGVSVAFDKVTAALFPIIEDFQKVGEGMGETMIRVASNYSSLDAILRSLGGTFGQTGMGSLKAREGFINLSGGIDKLASQTEAFSSAFLSESERLAPVSKYLGEQMALLGLAGIKSKDQFKDAVLGLAQSGQLATDSGAKNYAALMALVPLFAQVFDSYQETIDKARSAVAEAYNAESDALKSTVDRLQAFKAGILSFRDSLMMGSMSTLTPVQKLAEAQRQYELTLAKAKTGDTAAQAALQGAASAYLSADQVIKASSDSYAADAAKVRDDLAALALLAGSQASDAERQLAALDKQVAGLIDVNKSVLSTREAILDLGAALRAAGQVDITAGRVKPVMMPLQQADGDVPLFEAKRYGAQANLGADALVAEIRGLRDDNRMLHEEIKGLRADKAQQTGDTIASIEGAAERNAEMVSCGAKEAAKVSIYAQQMKAELA